MSLESRINDEMKTAMKNGDKLRLETLRSIRASIIEFAKSGAGREMNADDEINLLNSIAKKRKDAIEMYKNAGRNELMDKEQAELQIIMEFLPKQLTMDELLEEIKAIINENGFDKPSDVGKLIGASIKKLKGQADSKMIQQIAKDLLGA
jgi:uncharacterized protein YqeY